MIGVVAPFHMIFVTQQTVLTPNAAGVTGLAKVLTSTVAETRMDGQSMEAFLMKQIEHLRAVVLCATLTPGQRHGGKP
jgi:hypothetical protein